ncbi:helix-turn-helix domain-containing protein [Chitinophaga cymbidii]|uniref:AraC family transcriptional regulator n=1 Tax=Chitinophaga cymbidii TaxID=1096750 RepID=A0A512RR73_9BACT|nr:helix-turn-helix domain-containing protein [Chitinophaga cymbidii]GEP98209.1 AraC family transcriptional regulator [Chitinophaga cymbidii]
MIYREFPPHPLLAPYVECYWKADADKPPFRDTESLIPDGTIELMFNFGDDYAQVKNGAKETVKGSHIIGIRKHALHISQTSHQHVFSIRFRPGGSYPFFRIPVHLFANGFWSIRELLGEELQELEEQLYDTEDAERVRLTDRFLLARLRLQDEDYRFTAGCAKWLLKNPGLPVAEACRMFGANYKKLERKFNQVIGLTPSELLKIQRFNKAILTMYSCRFPSLTEVAYACGFYDQSHFIREFRQLSGHSPRQFLKEQFTIVQVIQPALADRLSKSYNL